MFQWRVHYHTFLRHGFDVWWLQIWYEDYMKWRLHATSQFMFVGRCVLPFQALWLLNIPTASVMKIFEFYPHSTLVYFLKLFNLLKFLCYHHHHISVMQLGHLLTCSGLTYPEALQRSTMIPSARWTVVFHYTGLFISRHSVYML